MKGVKRVDFSELFNELEKNQIIVLDDRSMIQEKILRKNYPSLNLGHSFLLKYTWDSQVVIKLDKSNNFEEDF